MLGTAQGVRIGITGLGVHVPEQVVTNDELAEIVETSDEWIRERTGIRERRIASHEEALTDIAMPAARAALDDAGMSAEDIDLLICATVTPDMMFPTSSALMADALDAPQAAAYDLLAGCTGFMYALAQAYGMLASGLSRRALVVGGKASFVSWQSQVCIHERIPGSRLDLFEAEEGGRHFMFMENPGRFNAVVREFLG